MKDKPFTNGHGILQKLWLLIRKYKGYKYSLKLANVD